MYSEKNIWHKRHDKQKSSHNKNQALQITINGPFRRSLQSLEEFPLAWMFVFQIILVYNIVMTAIHQESLISSIWMVTHLVWLLYLSSCSKSLTMVASYKTLTFFLNITRNFLGRNSVNFFNCMVYIGQKTSALVYLEGRHTGSLKLIPSDFLPCTQ